MVKDVTVERTGRFTHAAEPVAIHPMGVHMTCRNSLQPNDLRRSAFLQQGKPAEVQNSKSLPGNDLQTPLSARRACFPAHTLWVHTHEPQGTYPATPRHFPTRSRIEVFVGGDSSRREHPGGRPPTTSRPFPAFPSGRLQRGGAPWPGTPVASNRTSEPHQQHHRPFSGPTQTIAPPRLVCYTHRHQVGRYWAATRLINNLRLPMD